MVKRKLSVVKRIRAAASLLLFCRMNELCNGIGVYPAIAWLEDRARYQSTFPTFIHFALSHTSEAGSSLGEPMFDQISSVATLIRLAGSGL
jgi:hypothetical protein